MIFLVLQKGCHNQCLDQYSKLKFLVLLKRHKSIKVMIVHVERGYTCPGDILSTSSDMNQEVKYSISRNLENYVKSN